MTDKKSYFFCGIGGSGMLPLAMIVHGHGHYVEGSDRALDQGRTAAKFEFLKSIGVKLFPQDGSGVTNDHQALVASAAIEETVPDVAAALRLGVKRITRAALLAEFFNAGARSIAVGGTSGKSTTTAMIGWILHHAGKAPTVMNGAVMKNFVRDDALFASALIGDEDLFVSEVDESDGSIALFEPEIAVLNNISQDHKTLDELRDLFADFIGKADMAVLNLDNEETAALAQKRDVKKLTYSLADNGFADNGADFYAKDIEPQRAGVAFTVEDKRGGSARIILKMPGKHNVSNALAAIAAASALGVTTQAAGKALTEFTGVKRRFEFIGEANGVTVIDDFGHNPDKIAATLRTLHDFPGRLLVFFQPHGFGPLRLMKDDLIACFRDYLQPEDHLLMPQPVYYGGSVDRSVSSEDIVAGVAAAGRRAQAFASREECEKKLLTLAGKGDRIVIMGARDDTLSQFATDLLAKLSA